ncbi:Dam family site-specific DNA-(adenine-N6)-methyltransferase [Leptotrichia sp.]|uniref:Dam family site-specific DNA-(adenine-N6)-methyltransferase n=1 Tax=Leptotrichia sp. TaxID=104608 RepID=UPI0017D5C30A|nr:Dam family site-specific DNA-(adenine-N6)-methyltransferase [Leptotrichia sp.]MBB1534714.1 Dam family site-specific DNA-(adenine-N6)-methyltransferase [Leptotrichia sp.]
MKSIIRSPFFYVGDKYKLMSQLKKLFPTDIDNYYEPFVGGGSSFLNTEAKKFYLNDVNKNIIKLHCYLYDFKKNREKFFEILFKTIEEYGLSCSFLGKTVPDELKKEFVKTYYSRYNKENYLKMREDYNKDKKNLKLLYLLLIYGFNHMIRFNLKGDFNLPVGNVDFNQNVFVALNNYFDFSKKNNLKFFNQDYKEFLNSHSFKRGDFIYFDPPYLISNSEYNKMWSEKDERKLYQILDNLNKKNVRFGLSNLVIHKDKENEILLNWMEKYKVYEVNSNYISRFDNTKKINSREVYVTNYEN